MFDVETEVGGHATVVRCRLNAPATLGAVLRVADGGGTPATLALEPAPPAGPRSRAGCRCGRAGDGRAPGARGAGARPGGAILSYSSLAAYARCGYRYYLEREVGLPERPAADVESRRGGLDARGRGVLVHEALEALDFADPRVPEPSELQAAAAGQGIAISEREAKDIAGLVAGFAGSELRARLAGGGGVP